MPEAKGRFRDVPGITRAGCTAARRTGSTRSSFCIAARIVRKGRTVASDSTGRSLPRGLRFRIKDGEGIIRTNSRRTGQRHRYRRAGAHVRNVARIGCSSGVFASYVTVDVELRVDVPFQRAQPRTVVNRYQRAVRTNRCIRQLRRVEPPCAHTVSAGCSDIQLLVEQRTMEVKSAAALGDGLVGRCCRAGSGVGAGTDERARSRQNLAIVHPGVYRSVGRCYCRLAAYRRRDADHRARIHAVPEGTHNSVYLIVSPTWIKRRLENEVGGFVCRIPRRIERVVQAAIVARSKYEGVGIYRAVRRRVAAKTAAAERLLRALDRNRHGDLVVNGFRHPKSAGSLPGEADKVLRVDHQREPLVAIHDTLAVFRRQAPHLTARKRPAVREVRAAPQLSLPEHIRVALPVVRRSAGAKEVRLVVPAELDVANFRINKKG